MFLHGAEGFAREILAKSIFWAQNVPKFISSEAIKLGIVGIVQSPNIRTFDIWF
jgi:hypothetical protein